MSDPGLIVALIGVLTTLGTGLSWYVNRRDKAKDPIPKTAAELAVAQTALGIVEASAGRLDREVVRISGALEQERTRGDGQQRQLDSQQEQIDTFKALLSHATRYIETLLRAWGSSPIAPAVPAPLHELIDATLHPED